MSKSCFHSTTLWHYDVYIVHTVRKCLESCFELVGREGILHPSPKQASLLLYSSSSVHVMVLYIVVVAMACMYCEKAETPACSCGLIPLSLVSCSSLWLLSLHVTERGIGL